MTNQDEDDINEDTILNEKQLIKCTKRYGQIVNYIESGYDFGRDAIQVSKDKEGKIPRRGATIIACEKVECLIIFRAEFMKVKDFYNKDAIKKSEYIKKMVPFMNKILNEDNLNKLIYYFT